METSETFIHHVKSSLCKFESIETFETLSQYDKFKSYTFPKILKSDTLLPHDKSNFNFIFLLKDNAFSTCSFLSIT